MALGHKTGGRAPGTPNKRTQEAAQILDELGCNPIRGMAEIAMSESHPVELRARMFLELAHYVYPKRKTVDVHVAEPEPPAQATSDDVIRWLDEKAERVQAREPGKKLMELLDKQRVSLLAGTQHEHEDQPEPEHVPGSHSGSQAGGFVATSVDAVERQYP